MAEADGFVFVLDEELSEDDLVAMTVTTPSGQSLQLWAEVELSEGAAILRQFAIYGANAQPGEFGQTLLRDLAQAAMEEFDVDLIRIEETRRAKDQGPGRAVRPLRFRRRKG
ncbi:MAG: hypothetical protein KAT39_14025 [Alphaproteobacteria bacterium]|nr:hypothetical protein [Alphaproteobacteria bacterium]